ncbi:MAG: tRNA 2-selenouridine(34) synthase MnmH [Pseudomonadales bacterium]|nr:tRNA 2-selenouridine(34) synthase MnmH [Pseudomonadales bacterium]NRA16311.1 tRNA 2-selenouridine(34) synthase MnmH [Oceanospirillaceae bacterium]
MNPSADYLSIILNDIPLFDVRAPIEYDKGCINSALNLPLMSDLEREQVGTCYKNAGQDAAIALGRKLVTPLLQQQRTQSWMEFCEQFPQGFLYCFRGGLRSKITQQWLSEAGVDYPFIEGGYKAMRRFLIDELETSVETVAMQLISGRTGCGKTRLLLELQNMIDLEGLANHRGSSFGAASDNQPSQINFENAVSTALLKQRYRHQGTVYLEDEGRMIGSLTLPVVLKEKMESLSHIELETPLEQRITYAIEDYILILLKSYQQTHDQESAFELLAQRHKDSLSRIQKRLGSERYRQACQLLDQGISTHRNQNSTLGYSDFIELILTKYYDPMYDYQLSQRADKSVFSGSAAEIKDYIKASEQAINTP